MADDSAGWAAPTSAPPKAGTPRGVSVDLRPCRRRCASQGQHARQDSQLDDCLVIRWRPNQPSRSHGGRRNADHGLQTGQANVGVGTTQAQLVEAKLGVLTNHCLRNVERDLSLDRFVWVDLAKEERLLSSRAVSEKGR